MPEPALSVCPTCGLRNPGPEHRAHEPMLCADRNLPRAAFVYVYFQGQIKLSKQEVIEVDGDVAQAIQNRVGPTGALVTYIDAEEERDV